MIRTWVVSPGRATGTAVSPSFAFLIAACNGPALYATCAPDTAAVVSALVRWDGNAWATVVGATAEMWTQLVAVPSGVVP